MKRILFFFALLVSVVTFAQKTPQNIKGAKPMKVEFLGVSKKLTNITPIPNRTKATENDVYVVPNKLTKTGPFSKGPNSAPDPVVQKASPRPFATGGGQVLQGFDGASNADNDAVNGIMVAPPDTQGDVGPNHYIQMVNSLTTIYDKSGNILLGPVPNSVFFQDLDPRLAGTNDGDPVVLYDQFADRWIVSQFAVGAGAPFAMLVAISTTPDPLGTYNQYAIFYGDDFPDYPKLGIWNDALFITTRDFNPGFIGFSLVALNREDIINGVADARSQRFQILNPGFDGILPADADGDLAPPAEQAHPSLYMGGGNELNLILTTVDFDNPDNSTMTFDTVPIAPFNFFETMVPQPNGQTLDVLPFFLMYRLQYRNFGTHASMVTNHSVQEVAGGPFGVRWYEFRDTGTTPWEVFQQGTFLSDDDLNRWMGSIAMNADGDIALGYSVSSATLAPSIRFAGQSASESGSGILNIPETSILEGTLSSNGTNRWGDYSMMSVDPVDEDFWFTTEYIANDTGFSGWGTFISEMTFGDPPVAICQDITLELDANDGSISITPEDIDNGSTDASGGSDITLALDIDTFDCSNAGENIVTLTVTDAEGITASCTAVVTLNIIDEEAPVAVCQDISIQLDGDTVEITPEQVDGGSTDNCAIAELALDQSVFTETGSFTVTLTVTDVAGLTDTCEATVTVAAGPAIMVDPLELDAAVDVEITNPPVDEETFTITNNGGLPLDFDIAVGDIDFTPDAATVERLANLDRSIYRGNGQGSIQRAGIDARANAAKIGALASSVPVRDSLFLDSGVAAPGDFVGLGAGGVAFGFGLRFVVPEGGFNLNAVRNAARTEDFGATDVLLQVFGGDALPDPTQLLTEQLVPLESVDGSFDITILNEAQEFEAGDVFWIVHNYPMGIDFPQGFDDTLPGDAADYAITTDGGATFANQGGFAILVRAIDALAGFISLSPESGTVAAGESVEVTATFDATDLPNGVFESDILVNSNDANDPTVTVATTFTVSGVPADPFAILDPENVAVTAVVDQVQDVEITLSNDGESDLEFSFPQFGATNSADLDLYRAKLIDFPNFPANPEKGFTDNRRGNPVPFVAGTDLEFGYTWMDSDADGGPTNNFMDITGTGTDITADVLDGAFPDGTTSVGLPFAFPFYGADFETLFINANGIMAFQDPTLPTFTNQQIPVDDNANNIIAPFWNDLEPAGGANGTVHVDSNAERVIVQWTNTPAFLATGTMTFQVVLFPDGSIDMYYEDVETADFLDAGTIGIENADGTDGAQVAFNTPFIRDDFAIRFTPPTRFITGVAPAAGTLAPGAEQILSVTVDATGLDLGVFTEDLTVSSNSVNTSRSTSTFELTAAVEIGVDNPPVDVQTFTITNVGGLPLDFTTEIGESDFTPADATLADRLANLDRRIYGLGNPSSDADLQVAEANGLEIARILANESVEVLDSLLLDSGVDVPVNFVGFGPGGPPVGFAIRFVAPAGGFSLNAVRNAARTEDFGATDVLLQVFGGDALPDPSQLLTEQLVPLESVDGSFDVTVLNEPQQFEEGDVFWIVNNYPMGIDFAQGFDETLAPDDTNYAFTSDGGVTFTNLGGFAFLVRALNVTEGLITLSPEEGTVAPGESVEVEVTFNGAGQEFGVYETDIAVNSNDSTDPSVPVATTFTVSGDDGPDPVGPIIETTPEDGDTLDFGQVDTGETGAATVTVSNVGDETLVISEVNSSEEAFVVDVDLPLEIDPGASVDVEVSFTPDETGVVNGELSIVSNDGQGNEEIVIFLTGEGIEEGPAPDITFVLINAGTDMPIGPLADGDVVNLAQFPDGTTFNIEALVGDLNVGSVIFDFNGVNRFRAENVAPYALGGDSRGNFRAVDIPLGANTVTATAFTARGGRGDLSGSATIDFEFVNDFPSDQIELVLYNATTDIPLGVVDGPVTIDLGDFPEGTEFTVEALVSGFNDESVVFDLNDVSGFNIENSAPYSLAGDIGLDFFSAPFAIGMNTVTATAFDDDGGNGLPGPSITVTIEFVGGGDPGSSPIDLMLINTDTDTAISGLEDGQEIDLSALGGVGLSIEAIPDLPNVGSVRFSFNGVDNFRTENIAPYALAGDRLGDFRPAPFILGVNTVTVDVFERRGGNGALMESRTISFTVVDGAAMVVQISPNPVSDNVTVTMANSDGGRFTGTLFNFFGQAVFSNLDVDLRSGKTTSLNVSGLSQGVYILELRDKNGVIVSRVKMVKK